MTRKKIKIIFPKKELIKKEPHCSLEEIEAFERFLKRENGNVLNKIEKVVEKTGEINAGQRKKFLKWLRTNLSIEFSAQRNNGTEIIISSLFRKEKMCLGILPSLDYILFWLAKTWKNSWKDYKGNH